MAWDKGIPIVCIPYQDPICIIYSTVGRSVADISDRGAIFTIA